MTEGVSERRIDQTPIAIVDFETTGVSPNFDRIIEIGVVRCDPGRRPRVVLDTLVNPQRPVAGTQIHGITDADVAGAPPFDEVAGDLIDAVSGCVVSAYNVYFDIKFLTSELGAVDVRGAPPHFCLMYMRPMLGLGKRCRLEDACKLHGISNPRAHVAAEDALVSAKLLELYLEVLDRREIRTYADLASLKNYKFMRSFRSPPLSPPAEYGLSSGADLVSRSAPPGIRR